MANMDGDLWRIHTGSFAQNYFQIDSINSCRTSKKLQFWLKYVRMIYFLTLKPIKGKLGFILDILKKKSLAGATSQKSQKYKNHDIFTIILVMTWVSKDATWST